MRRLAVSEWVTLDEIFDADKLGGQSALLSAGKRSLKALRLGSAIESGEN
jgi:hypothetical protein